MKKIIIAFAAGQGLQLLINYLSHDMVYANQQVWFCAGAGIIVLVAMIIGAWDTLWNKPVEGERKTYIDHAEIPKTEEATLPQIFGKRAAEDMDEVAELPKEIKVTNTAVIREMET